MLFGDEMNTRQLPWLLWKGKYRILSCALAAAIVGVLVTTALPKVYEANLVARSAGQAAFAPFSDLMSVTPGNWHMTTSIVATVRQSFLAVARDRDYFKAYVQSNQDLLPGTKLNDPDVLQKIVYERFDVIPPKDSNDDTFQFRFRYDTGTSGAQLLNGFVKAAIEKTIESLYANGRLALATTKKSKENDLLRLREVRDIGVRQLMLRYQQALDAAKSANIENPTLVNPEATAALGAGASQMPLFLFGSRVLATELKNIEARNGNDLAIPEFGVMAASIADVGRRLTALDQTLGVPIVITQLAYESRPVFPPKTPIMLICIAIGAVLGGCWQYLKSHKPEEKSQA